MGRLLFRAFDAEPPHQPAGGCQIGSGTIAASGGVPYGDVTSARFVTAGAVVGAGTVPDGTLVRDGDEEVFAPWFVARRGHVWTYVNGLTGRVRYWLNGKAMP